MKLKPTRTEQMIITRVGTSLSSGRKITVDGVRIKDIRFNGGELEVEWDAEIGDDDFAWTVIQPNYLHEEDNGEIEIKTY
jgi:hypothetical protein